MKIYNQGRLINGRFSSLKSQFVKWFVRVYFVWFAFTALTLAYGFGSLQLGVVHAENIETKVVDLTPQKIEALKADVVDRLEACESAGHKEDDAIIMYDNNQAGTLKGKNVWSLGQLQFKVPTVQHYVKIRDGKQITQKEAVLLALDRTEARALASYVIFETDKGINNWLNCANKLGLHSEITIIKKLSK